jgi:hypothetical protein
MEHAIDQRQCARRSLIVSVTYGEAVPVPVVSVELAKVERVIVVHGNESPQSADLGVGVGDPDDGVVLEPQT